MSAIDAACKERPILFSAPMVRAILVGQKSVTRRVVKRENAPSPGREWAECLCREIDPADTPCVICDARFGASPYGDAGDRLWVRETWATLDSSLRRRNVAALVYRADTDGSRVRADAPWKPSIHMSRWASRLVLEVKSVSVERLHEITEDDARAEGLSCLSKDGGKTYKYGIPDRDGLPGADDVGQHWHEWKRDPLEAFRQLWDSINAARGYSWASNPWVWRIEFRRVEAP